MEIGHRRPDGAELLRLFVRDVDVESLLERHDELDRIEAVGAEIFHEARIVGELVALDPELFDDDVFDLLLELLHVHCHGYPQWRCGETITAPSRRRRPAPD